MRSILLLLLLVLAAPALASDGVLEINQTCAEQTGCFPGDAAGFPVSISSSGSYRLASSLVVPDENTDGIYFTVEEVSIDLAGFEIRGPVVCSGPPTSCSPSGSGVGIGRSFASVPPPPAPPGASVRNGTIRGMGYAGVLLGERAEVRNLQVQSNAQDGISIGGRSIIADNRVSENEFRGIRVGGLDGSIISGNTVSGNGGEGIFANYGGLISGNMVESNGVGINARAGSSVQNNVVRSNSTTGLQLQADCGYGGNVLSGNGGTVTSGVETGTNLCNGTTTCP